MVILRDSQGRPVVRVPGSFWYNIVGTSKYEFAPDVHSEIRSYDCNIVRISQLIGIDANGSNSYETEQLVKEAEEYVSCVNHYVRDKDGELVRYGDDVDKESNATFNMRYGIVVEISQKRYSAIEIKRGYWIPFSSGAWNVIKRMRDDGTIIFKDGKYRDIDYVISEMIQYMHDNLPKEIKPKSSNVDHPQHYNHGGTETIEVIKERLSDNQWNAYEGGLLFNVYKYIDRAPYKGKLLEDLKKAQWYLNKLIEENEDV